MLEIGSTLENARLKRGLELADVERETNLRERYLRALEQEQFELLPPGGYRRTFLRGYATFLGLDAGVLVDEYTSRYEQPERLETELLRPARPARRSGSTLPFSPVLAAVAVAALALVGVAIWRLGGGSQHPDAAPPPTTVVVRQHPPPPRIEPPPTTTAHHAVAKRPTASVAFSASGGDCWLEIHAGSEQGRVIYEGVLQQDQKLTFKGRRFWARIGAPGSLALTVDGKPQTLPAHTSNVTVDARGVRAA